MLLRSVHFACLPKRTRHLLAVTAVVHGRLTCSAAPWSGLAGIAQRIETRGESPIDLRRVALTAAFGGLAVGPAGAAWYQWLDDLVLKLGLACSTKSLLLKCALDNFIWTPVHLLGFFSYGCLAIDGMTRPELVQKLQDAFLPTLCTEMLLWPPVMALVFHCVPVRHQLLAINVGGILDAAFLSFVRTRSDEQDEAEAMQASQQQVQQHAASSSSSSEPRRKDAGAAASGAAPQAAGAWESQDLITAGKLALLAACSASATGNGLMPNVGVSGKRF